MPVDALEKLLAPLGDDAPCGANLAGTPAFQALERASAGKPEHGVGSTLVPAQDPNWREVHELATEMAEQTRDLRVAVLLARSGAHLQGLAGAVAGLQFVQLLLDRHWPHVHPPLDASDHDDPTERLFSLAPLAHADEFLRDVRGAGLTARRGSMTVRDIELALGKVDADPDESVPTEAGVLQEIAERVMEFPKLREHMCAGVEAAKAIVALIDARAPGSAGPDLSPLVELMQHLAVAAQRAVPAADAALSGHAAHDGPADQQGRHSVAVGTIASREDAVRTLERVCEWIERNEPTNPAPLLIKRAKGLMTKDFLEIIRDLLPDGIGEVEKLAGIKNG